MGVVLRVELVLWTETVSVRVGLGSATDRPHMARMWMCARMRGGVGVQGAANANGVGPGVAQMQG